MTRWFALLVAVCLFWASSPAIAAWKEMTAGTPIQVANSSMTVTPSGDWNRWSFRPSLYGEIWTRDGVSLNELSFFAQIPNGQPIYREQFGAEQPLPKFKSDMLLTDVVELFEASNRIVLKTSIFQIDRVEPAKLGVSEAVRFNYSYALQGDELARSGEAIAAIIDGKLYVANFVAPSIHYFEYNVASFREMAASIKIPPQKSRR
jgi:hypothetical protein